MRNLQRVAALFVATKTAPFGAKPLARYYRLSADTAGVRSGHEGDLFAFRLGLVAGVQYADDHAGLYGANTKAGWIFVSCHI